MSSFTVTDAGDGDDVLTITSITATPASPSPGGYVQVTIQGTTSEDITDGAYVDVTVKLGVIRILGTKLDLFAALRADSTTVGSTDGSVLTVAQRKDSTIPAGDFTLTYTLTLPSGVPRATFNVSVYLWNADDADIASVLGRLSLIP
jgi:hypothetical protein